MSFIDFLFLICIFNISIGFSAFYSSVRKLKERVESLENDLKQLKILNGLL